MQSTLSHSSGITRLGRRGAPGRQAILNPAQMLHMDDIERRSTGVKRLVELPRQRRHPAIACLERTPADERLEHVDRRAGPRQAAGQNGQPLVLETLQLAPFPVGLPQRAQGQLMAAPDQGINQVVRTRADEGRRVGTDEKDLQPASLDWNGPACGPANALAGSKTARCGRSVDTPRNLARRSIRTGAGRHPWRPRAGGREPGRWPPSHRTRGRPAGMGQSLGRARLAHGQPTHLM